MSHLRRCVVDRSGERGARIGFRETSSKAPADQAGGRYNFTCKEPPTRRRLEPGVSLVLAIDLAKFCFENLFLLTNANQLQWYEDQENQQIRRLLKK